MSWKGFDGRRYTRDQFSAHVANITIGPYAKFIVMHGTGQPTLKQWMEFPVPQRIANLQRYYENNLGWAHGPHLFIGPENDGIVGFSDLSVRGTHCSCWNGCSIGIETAGNWNIEDMNSGDGAAVRDNFVFAAAVLHKHLGLRPDGYIKGVRGLHFHRECAADGHLECPQGIGGNLNKDDLVARILAAMDAMPLLAPNPDLVAQATKMPTDHLETHPRGSVAWVQDKLNAAGATPPLDVDGDFGVMTKGAVGQFQRAHSLTVDCIVGPATLAALDAVA